MKLRRTTKEALALSVTVHVVGVIGIFLLILVNMLRAKEEPVVLELVQVGEPLPETTGSGESRPAQPSQPAEAPPSEDFRLPQFDQIKPAPEVKLPEPPPPEPPPVVTRTPTPRPTPPPQPPPQPAPQMSIEEFRRLQGTPTRPTTVVNQRQPQRPVPAPTISRVDPSQLTSNLAMDSFDFSSVAVGQRDALQTYFEQLMQRLRNAFAPTAPLEARVEFRLERDGRLTNVRIIRSSGNEAFDQAALQACYRTRGPGTPPGNPPYTRTVTFNGVR